MAARRRVQAVEVLKKVWYDGDASAEQTHVTIVANVLLGSATRVARNAHAGAQPRSGGGNHSGTIRREPT